MTASRMTTPRATTLHTGRCNCGAIRFSVTGPMRPVVACHCRQCRKTTGNFVAATSAPRAAIAITGAVTWFQSSETARRGFCSICGCSMFWDGPGVNLSVMAGALDKPTDLALTGHIFCADKGDWYQISDGLPQAPSHDSKMTTKVGA